jgi:hypothetical protein
MLSDMLSTPKKDEVIKSIKRNTKRAVRKKVKDKIGEESEK